jgi:hypothetical protein
MPISSVVLVILLGIAVHTDSQPKNQLLLSELACRSIAYDVRKRCVNVI